MKVILLENVPSLGERGTVCEVADGHARNFLFPRSLAKQATPQSIKEAKEECEKLRKQSERELSQLQQVATKLDGYELYIDAPVSEADTLYAAVGAQKVAQELKEKGFNIKKTQVDMHSIKEPGEYKAIIRFDHGLEAEINITVSEAP